MATGKRIIEGLEDAIAYTRGDASRAEAFTMNASALTKGPPMPTRTIESLEEADAYEGLRTLKRGDKGSAVRDLQFLLWQFDLIEPNLETDGIFGVYTDEAVRQFQERTGLKVDGIVGPKTWAALECATLPMPAEPVVDFDYMDQPPEDNAWRWIGLAIVAFAVVLFVGYLATAGP